jgi:hypothetical protein
MAGSTKIPLGGSNVMVMGFGKKEYYWAFTAI